MQKLFKRTAQAQRQAGRRARQRVNQEAIDTRIRNRQTLQAAVSEVRQNLKDAKRARQEDWEMGPLAPKRDLGFNNYGAFTENARQDWSNYGLYQLPPRVVEQRCAWAGGVKQLNLAPQDRVVIMDGPDKGKIDRIKAVHAGNGTVTLETHHRALAVGMFGNPARSQAMPISINSIRLVYPIRNPETGVTRDVIINQLKAVPPNMQSDNMTLDRWEYGKKWDRLVPGINVVIPWPEVEAPEYEAMPADTVRDQVEDRTFHYGLLAPPMPEGVVDELRNKYSRFRTRHEPWYIEEKNTLEAIEAGQDDAARLMQTPLQEFHEMQREIRDSQGEPELSVEMLEKLGQIMAQKKAAALEQAGVSEVSEGTSPAPGPQ
ncbi:hypothetical protein JDV02_002574 [Purpureocillium takamizusanense]|uniref:KOW motif containing protein n=1 Tax=Purpureocillium takamizusanense TaxID=2060973 RepID=A0A9Q8QAL1_9HYPO|nr:uncharacterized protein JDV02_002574 [Purpureocillium takamizusanense]UNI16105.1 hypothetical protein JDV02_002574 [Purpureocillium takamizusanense]